MPLIDNNKKLESDILKLKEKLDRLIKGGIPTIFDKSFWEGQVLGWAMKDSAFKVDLLRFVDVLPSLETSRQITEHLNEYLLKDGRELPGVISIATKAASNWLTSGVSSLVIKKGAKTLAQRFIIGSSAEKALPKMRKLYDGGIGFTADILGEATLSNSESKTYQKRYIDLISVVSDEVKQWPTDESLSSDCAGPIPVANVSIKISAMDPQLNSLDPAGAVSRLKEMVLPILILAKEKNVFVNFDMEQWEYHEITYNLFEEILFTPELKSCPHLGIVIQAYLKESEKDFERLLLLAKLRGTAITVRLVKGAYWDFEVVNALSNGLPCPVYTRKENTDANYELLTRKLLDNVDYLRPAFGSHNHRSLLNAIATADDIGVSKNAYEIQMLYGMAEPERMAFKELASRLRLYAPIGELLPGIGYLVRRLLENMSNSGFLRMSYHEGADEAKLLAKPHFLEEKKGIETKNGFRNAPFADFTNKKNRNKYLSAISDTGRLLPVNVPVVVDGRERFDGDTTEIFCPSESHQLVSRAVIPSESEAESAVVTAMRAYPKWLEKRVEERSAMLEKLAGLLEENRADIAALETLEVGKPIREADADVAEAIDFCRYYAARARVELLPRKMGNTPGEDNSLFYEGRGPTVIITPWNFPAAILCGMATAALVAGNPVILKPSGRSPAVAYRVYQLFIRAGFPSSVVQFIPGAGESVGDYLVKHPSVVQVAFTGSKEVGLSIIEKAAKVLEGQPQVKRVICEMGGKNAIIVDDDADIDEAVLGVIKSAFGYAGQKCSACSRVIIVGEQTYRNFANRLVEACKSIIISSASKPECRLGPVVSEAAYKRLMEVINNPGKGANLLFVKELQKDFDNGYFAPPALFEVSDAEHPLMQKEFFGPIVALMQVETFEEALDAAVSTEFALTGGIFSRSPKHLEMAKRKFRVGNLYFNRNITGAFVYRQPFGGFGMSGTGIKAGGPGYLLHFADSRTISENSMRSGYAPEVEDI